MSEHEPRETPLHGRALLIEDNAIVALDTQDMLQTLGFDPVDIAASAAEALQLARKHTYSAAVCDLMVKDGSSLPAAEYLAANGVPLVIASGYSEQSPMPAFAGAPRVTKPYDQHMLHQALLEARKHVARKL